MRRQRRSRRPGKARRVQPRRTLELEALETRECPATITINASQIVRPVSSQLLGVNLAWWDTSQNTTQTEQMVQAAGLTLFRFPGGSSSDDFHFNAPPTYNGEGTIPSMASFIAAVGGRGMATLDYGGGSPQEAAAFLAYLNATTSNTTPIGAGQEWSDSSSTWTTVNWQTAGSWANLRAATPLAHDDGLNFMRLGRTAPFGIHYWEVGNEEYGSWEIDHHSTQHDPATYVAFAKAFAGYAAQIDPAISIGIDTGDPGGDSWIGNVLNQCVSQGFTPGFLSDHSYMQGPGNESDSFLLFNTVSNPNGQNPGYALAWSLRASQYRQLLNSDLGSAAANVELLATEFNSVYANTGKQSTSLVNGLFVADSLANLLETEYNAGVVWDLRNGWSTGNNNSSSLYGWRQGGDYGLLGSGSGMAPSTGTYVPYPNYFAEQLVSKMVQPGANVVQASSNDANLAVYAVQESNGHLELLVINKNATTNLAGQFQITGFTPSSQAALWQYGKSEDTAQSLTTDGHAALTNLTAYLSLSGSNFSYTFPSYSMSVLDLVEATGFTVSAPPSATAGTPFTVTVTAHDGSGNIVTGYKGTVHFTSTDTHAALPGNVTLTNGVGSFPVTLTTVGTWTVQAQDTAGISGLSGNIMINPAATSQFAITGTPASIQAGTPFSITVTAKDSYGNTTPAYAGTIHFTSTDPLAAAGSGLPANYPFTGSGTGKDNGVHTFSNVTLFTAGNQTISAADLSINGSLSPSNAVNVTPGAFTKYVVSLPSGNTVTAGNSFQFMVQAADPYGNAVASYSGPSSVSLSTTPTDPQGSIPASLTLNSLGQGSGQGTLKTAGSYTLTAASTQGMNTYTGTSPSLNVTPGAFTKYVVGLQSGTTVAAGNSFLFTVQAADPYGNAVTSYTGPSSVSLSTTPTDPQGNIPSSLTLNSLGQGFAGGTIKTAGPYTLTAMKSAQGHTYSGTSPTLTITPAAADYFVFSTPATVTAGVAFPLTITVKDLYGNTVPTYHGTVQLTSTDPAAKLGSNPLPTTFSFPLNNGTDSLTNVILITSGNQKLTLTDTAAVNPPITGTSSAVDAIGLQVSSVTPTATGFTVNFNEPFLLSSLHLYGAGNTTQPALRFYSNTIAAPLDGSLVVNAAHTSFTFVESTLADQSGGLPDGTYGVSLLSSPAALTDVNSLPLDVSNSPNSGPNLYPGNPAAYTTTFTLNTLTNLDHTGSQVAISLPAFAQGPGAVWQTVGSPPAGYVSGVPGFVNVQQPFSNPVTYFGGIPATISDGNHTTTASFQVTYNTALLAVTGAQADSTTLASYPSATFTRTAGAPSGGMETDTFTFTTHGAALATGQPWTLGELLATVPNAPGQTIYQAKELLPVSNIAVDGGSLIQGSNVLGGNGFQVVAFLGDGSGDGQLTTTDAAAANNAALGHDTGFAAYSLVDPVVLADTDAQNTVDGTTVSNLAFVGAGHTLYFIPTPPAGANVNQAAPDPDLGVPLQVTASKGVVSVPVTLDNAKPAGSTGLTEATLALQFDPRVISVTVADVHLGRIPGLGTGWNLASVIDSSTGQLAIELYSLTPITQAVAGSLVIVDFHLLPGAVGLATVNLVDSVSPFGSRAFNTNVADTHGALILGYSTGVVGVTGLGSDFVSGSSRSEAPASALQDTLASSKTLAASMAVIEISAQAENRNPLAGTVLVEVMGPVFPGGLTGFNPVPGARFLLAFLVFATTETDWLLGPDPWEVPAPEWNANANAWMLRDRGGLAPASPAAVDEYFALLGDELD